MMATMTKLMTATPPMAPPTIGPMGGFRGEDVELGVTPDTDEVVVKLTGNVGDMEGDDDVMTGV